MGCIKIDDKLQKSEELSNFLLFLFEENRVKLPRLSIFEILLAKLRPGLDSDFISSSVISRFPKAGIPSGALEGGQSNVMEEYTKILVDEVVDSIQSDMRVDVAVDSGMMVIAAGGNAGGPVVTNGSNPSPHSGSGIAS